MEAVVLLRREGTRAEGMTAGHLLQALTRKRELLAGTPAKLQAIDAVVDSITDADRSIVFTHTVAAAEAAARQLQAVGVSADAIHARLDAQHRRDIMAGFALGSLQALTPVEVLDEGIDVPAADLAIVLAGSKQRRQMVQRMGRVMRCKPDGRSARFIITYVRGTSEDPECGAHEAFLDEVLDVASDVADFTLSTPAEVIRRFLAPFGTDEFSAAS